MNFIKEYITSLTSLIYPDTCEACGEDLSAQEEKICIKCTYDIPKTNYQLIPNNPLEEIFWGRVKIEHATALFFYSKGSKYQHLLHRLKYHSQTEIGTELGRILGSSLKNSRFKDIDLIIPVPLHPKKKRKRGYNQSDYIAKGIASAMEKDCDVKSLTRVIANPSQTAKSKYERWENVENIFHVKKTTKLENKHMLLIDDVVTTGSTIEACANALLKIPGVKVSIATLGYTGS